jgi:hypothetical protein
MQAAQAIRRADPAPVTDKNPAGGKKFPSQWQC